MATVPQAFIDRWRTGHHVGPAKPRLLVRVQPGMVDRHFAPITMLDGHHEFFGRVQGSKHQSAPWQGFWRSFGPWVDVPNVQEITVENDLSQQEGIGQATVHIENIIYRELMGTAGLYHGVARGYLAPWFGFAGLGRPGHDQPNEWLNVLNGGCRIKIWEGYGDDVLVPTFIGLIEDTDSTSSPDTITVTARSFGQMLTDQKCYGWNKAREIRSPIVFADRRRADNEQPKGVGAQATDYQRSHPPRNVTVKGASYWASLASTDPNTVKHIQVHIPAGHYETLYLFPRYPGMEAWVSIYARKRARGKPPLVNGVPVTDNAWVNIGAGNVPTEGQPFTNHWKSLTNKGITLELGCGITVGDNTIVRISFRKLHKAPELGTGYRAGASRLIVYRRVPKPEAKNNHWILVDDLGDVVKWALLWCGFKEWEVEPVGARIKDNKVFHQGDDLIEIVKWAKSQGAFVFYIDAPSDHPDSLGVPVFRRTRAVEQPQAGMLEVRDTDLITGLEPKFSKETLTFTNTSRGKTASRAQGGVTWGEDTTKRVQAVYFPPWSGAHRNIVSGQPENPDGVFQTNRIAGVWRAEVHDDPNLQDADDCMMANILIAIQQALAAFTAQLEMPGIPLPALDDQISVIDTGTGMNTRLWIQGFHRNLRQGETAEYKVTLNGSILDSPDLQQIQFDYFELVQTVLTGE